jgi:hypothetical protein
MTEKNKTDETPEVEEVLAEAEPVEATPEPVEPAEQTEPVATEAEPDAVEQIVSEKPAPKVVLRGKGTVPIPSALVALREEPAGPAVVGNGNVDEVLLSSCVYKNLYVRKSLTVHHLQRRLTELGYSEASLDKDGYYGDITKTAVARFQSENGIAGNGLIDAPTFVAIFDGDPNVKPVV